MTVFRDATEKDLEQIAAMEREAFSDAWSEQGLRETFYTCSATMVVAEKEEELVGYCIVYCVLDEGEIARIAVAEKARRTGVGKGLMEDVCRRLNKQQVKRLLLDVRRSNESARSFYEKYGFVEDGVRRQFYENPKEDAILMSMQLDEISTTNGNAGMI